MLFSLFRDISQKVGTIQKAKRRSVAILIAVAAIERPPFPHCSACIVHCGIPHWKATEKVENIAKSAMLPNRATFALLDRGNMRSMSKAEDSFASDIATILSIPAA